MLMISRPRQISRAAAKPPESTFQIDGHDSKRAPPAEPWRPVLPPGGAVAQVAPMCANRGNSGEPPADSWVWFVGRKLAGALHEPLRVTARHSASQCKARKSMILW
jgi:hypothetical protein